VDVVTQFVERVRTGDDLSVAVKPVIHKDRYRVIHNVLYRSSVRDLAVNFKALVQIKLSPTVDDYDPVTRTELAEVALQILANPVAERHRHDLSPSLRRVYMTPGEIATLFQKSRGGQTAPEGAVGFDQPFMPHPHGQEPWKDSSEDSMDSRATSFVVSFSRSALSAD
jgi:hypothetical protein